MTNLEQQIKTRCKTYAEFLENLDTNNVSQDDNRQFSMVVYELVDAVIENKFPDQHTTELSDFLHNEVENEELAQKCTELMEQFQASTDPETRYESLLFNIAANMHNSMMENLQIAQLGGRLDSLLSGVANQFYEISEMSHEDIDKL